MNIKLGSNLICDEPWRPSEPLGRNNLGCHGRAVLSISLIPDQGPDETRHFCTEHQHLAAKYLEEVQKIAK